jgi:tetratricopeptide (TPR) repeat protein
MAFAHAMGIVHRDIKPGNILIGNDGVYVLDFGIARAILASSDQRLTSTGVAIGTPAYMSPEQALSEKDIDTRSDIYSLGCVTYEMIAGIPPFVGATAQVVMSRRFVASPPPLRESRESVPQFVEAAIAKALAKAPADRWQSAEAFGKALSASPSVVAARIRLDNRRRKLGIGVLAVLGSILVAIGIGNWRAMHADGIVKAQAMLRQWNFEEAEATLHRALSKKQDDPVVSLWLAQVLMLKGSPVDEWKPFVLAAADGRQSLSAFDQQRLEALTALSAGKLTDACSKLDKLRVAEARGGAADQTATLASADCLRDNGDVIDDKTSPTGLAFASSYNLADSLYENLLVRNGSEALAYAALMPRLQKVLSVDPRMLRRGTVLRTGSVAYGQPALVDDTLAYVPFLPSASGSTAKLASASDLEKAITRNKDRIRKYATLWTTQAPDDPAAHEMMADLLEASGELDGARLSAATELSKARTLAATSRDTSAQMFLTRIRLAYTQVRVFVRQGNFAAAGVLADSVLAWEARPALDDKTGQAISDFRWRLSALRGNVEQVNQIEQQYASLYQVRLPSGIERPGPVIARDAIALANYASFGHPRDSILQTMKRLSANIPALVPPSKVGAMKSAILATPLAMAAPAIGFGPVTDLAPSSDPIVRVAQALGRGNRRLAKQYLDSLAALHVDRAPGEITFDVTVQESWLNATVGDSARAAKLLDNSLSGLLRAPPSMLGSARLIISLVRAMSFRAELAGKMNQPKTAEHWNSAVAQLWGTSTSKSSMGSTSSPSR